jgi:O-methyltransferase
VLRRSLRALKSAVRRTWPTLVHPKPVSSLQPQRLSFYLAAFVARRNLDGDALEVGCWLGGTAAIANARLQELGSVRRYVCVDTFSGFVDEQFSNDRDRHGTPAGDQSMFSGGGITVVRRLLDAWGASEVELIQGDIVAIDADLLPERIAVCLIDVDLEQPIYEGLRKIYPRLVPGGIILVDDCPPGTTWAGARAGYQRFVRDTGLPEVYVEGLGLVERNTASGAE